MRKILITPELHNDVTLFCDTLFNNAGAGFIDPITKLRKLRATFSVGQGSTNKRQFISEIIRLLPELKKAKPSEFDNHIQFFENIISNVNYEKGFADDIVDALRYDRLRDTDYPKFIKKYGIKSCVTCNAILTIVIDVDKSDPLDIKRKNMFELDHFLPSSKYPFFSTSFYNLHPSCGNCNRSKNSETTYFHLYTEDDKLLESFEFKIDDEAIVNYWEERKVENVKVEFLSVYKDEVLLENHNKYFKIQSIYDEQEDLLEELLEKSIAYNEASRQNLVNSFKSLFPDETIIKRLVIGNYDKPEDIHKRPLAKFTMDIAKQLGLI